MSNNARRTKRILAGVLAGSMALSVSPLLGFTGVASAADELPPLADPIGDGNYCEDMPEEEDFDDVADDDTAIDAITCLLQTGLTQGTGDGSTYEPAATITRRQMVLFLVRLADEADQGDTGDNIAALPAGDGETTFTDIADENADIQAAIDRLNEAGIVEGVTATEFSPAAPVSRRQMAAFIVRLQEYLTGAELTAAGDYFDDDNGDSGEENLNIAAELGIFQGDGAGNVNPGSSLSRRQMASVLTRTLQVSFAAGDIERGFEEDDSNQGIAVTPAEPALLTVSTGAAPNTNRGVRTFNAATGTATAVDIALIPMDDVIIAENGSVTFRDAAGGVNQADNVGVTATAVIETVGGADVVDAAIQNNVTPVGGQVTFTVDSTGPEAVYPVVFVDANNNNQLDLVVPAAANANPKAPSEVFGVGGLTVWVPEEAAIGASTPTVFQANTLADFMVSTVPETYYWDSNDTFQYQGVGITQDQFESMISAADVMAVSYNPDPAGVSVFNITTDAAPTAVGAPTVAVLNLDGGATANDARVTYTRPATNASGATYTLIRTTVAPGVDLVCGTIDDVAGASAPVATATEAPGTTTGQFVFTDMNVPNGCWGYSVTATNPISGTSTAGTAAAAVASPATPDTTAPTSTFLTQANTTGLAGTLDVGDTVTATFSEAMAPIVAGDTIRFTDGDGTQVDLVCGTNATCTLNAAPATVTGAPANPYAANFVLTVTVTAPPTVIGPGTIVGLSVATGAVSDQAGITDVAGNGWNLGAGDVALA